MKKLCAYCGKPFNCQRSSRLYCSNNCKQLAYYRRNGLILSGSTTGRLPDNDSVVKDVKTVNDPNCNHDSFMVRLNALIDEEVTKRMKKKNCCNELNVKDDDNYVTVNGNDFENEQENDSNKLSTDADIVKSPVSVKSSFTIDDNILYSSNEPTQDSQDTNIKEEPNPDISDLERQGSRLEKELRLGDFAEQPKATNDAIVNRVETAENNKHTYSEPFDWIYSSFTERIIYHLQFTEQEILQNLSSHGDNGVKVLEIFKCLIKSLLRLSNQKQNVGHASLTTVVKKFCRLVASKEFRSLPNTFIYHAKILALEKKIRSFLETTNKEEVVKLVLPVDQRASFFAILYEMGDRVKNIDLAKIDFRKSTLEFSYDRL